MNYTNPPDAIITMCTSRQTHKATQACVALCVCLDVGILEGTNDMYAPHSGVEFSIDNDESYSKMLL